MSIRLFTLSIIALLSLLLNACAPSGALITATFTETSTPQPASTPVPSATPSPAATPTHTPEPTATPTATPDVSGAIRVPEDQPTIQAGIDAAPDGGLVLISPGVYTENVVIARKSVTLASLFLTTGDEQYKKSTILDGSGQTVISVRRNAGPDNKVIGLTIRNGDDGIQARVKLQVLNNIFENNKDGLDYQDSGGLNSGNLYENNTDDGIDLDGSSEAIIENNIIRNNKDDGIEIRLHEHAEPSLTIIIRHNTITGNMEDGIQLIDYPDLSDRTFFIEHNLISGNAMAGLGLMDDGVSVQDFRAASIPERIYLINNTFVDNPYAVSGGDNLIALNNLFVNSSTLALKNVDGDSIVAYNLFWNNAVDSEGSNVDAETSISASPELDAEYGLRPGSPAIDAGVLRFEWNGEVVPDLEMGSFLGLAPDLGAFETDPSQGRVSTLGQGSFPPRLRD